MSLFVIINQLAFNKVVCESERDIYDDDGNGVLASVTDDTGSGGLHEADSSGLAGSTPSGGAPPLSDQPSTEGNTESPYYNGSDEDEDGSSIMRVTSSLLDIQQTTEELREAFQMTMSSLDSQLQNLMSKKNELSTETHTIDSTLQQSQKIIETEENKKHMAKENFNTASTNLSKLERLELDTLEQLVPIKQKLNDLTSKLKHIQESKTEQTMILDESKTQLHESEDTISRSMYDERTSKVNRTDIQSQLTEIENTIEKVTQQKEEQQQKFTRASTVLNKKLADEISKHGLGQKAVCSVGAVRRLKPDMPDDFQPPIKPTALAIEEEEVISSDCKNSCLCSTTELPAGSIDLNPSGSPLLPPPASPRGPMLPPRADPNSGMLPPAGPGLPPLDSPGNLTAY